MEHPSSRRLRVLAGQFAPATLASERFPEPAAAAYLQLDNGLLSESEKAIQLSVRQWMVSEVAPMIGPYWETATFPHQLIERLGAQRWGGCNQKGNGCSGLSLMSEGLLMVDGLDQGADVAVFRGAVNGGQMEMARVDASVSLFFLVHDSLCMSTIGALGSDEQKQRFLPRLAAFEHVGCWALTEPEVGSDAGSLATTATRLPGGGWRLDGHKRWIGNAPFADVAVVFARDVADGNVKAFVLEPKGLPGWHVTKMENKTGMRVVQNGDIVLTGVEVPEANRLPKCSSFKDATAALTASRLIVAWQPVGMAMGVYDMCLRYTSERRQFGAPLNALAINQEKLMRMLATVQGMLLVVWRVTRLAEAGQASPGMISLAKSSLTARGREVAALGRELIGGNGILHEFHCAKVFNDMEAVHTYEGTYDINMLVAAREVTGQAAFKPSRPSPALPSASRVR